MTTNKKDISQQLAEQDQSVPIKMNITLQGRSLLPLEMNSTDTLLEIKQFLNESTILNLFTNYHFTQNGLILNEYTEITSLNLSSSQNLDIHINPFDEKSAKQHVRRVQEVLANPSLLANIFEKVEDKNQESHAKLVNRCTKDSSDEETEEEVQNDKQKQESKQIAKNQTIDSNDNMNSTLKSSKGYTLNDAISPSLANRILTKELNPPKQELLEFVNFINFSGFNPPPHFRRIQGDFFYLSIKTLENISYHVTASPQGFFLNKSNSKVFDPEAIQKNQKFVSLIDLLKHISPSFKLHFDTIIRSEVNQDILDVPILSFYKYGHKWLTPKISTGDHEWNMNRCENSLVNLYGFDVNGPRDWNEELQICRDLPQKDFMQRLNRDKVNIKIQSQFVEAAIEGAKAVVDQNISPLNPMDPQHQQVFVYNQIFFSFAQENIDHFRGQILQAFLIILMYFYLGILYL